MITAGVTVVAEANFQDPLWRSGLEPLADLARLRIVQCHVDPAVARERREDAAEEGSGRFHARIIGEEIEDWEEAFASFDRVSIPAPSIDVNTTHGYAPDVREVVSFINR